MKHKSLVTNTPENTCLGMTYLSIYHRSSESSSEPTIPVWALTVRPTWTINTLRIACIIGVNPHEREGKQDVFLDLTFQLSDISLRWPEVARMVCDLAEESSFKTVEALAAFIGRSLIQKLDQAGRVDVRVEKPSAYAWAEAVGCEVSLNKEIGDG